MQKEAAQWSSGRRPENVIVGGLKCVWVRHRVAMSSADLSEDISPCYLYNKKDTKGNVYPLADIQHTSWVLDPSRWLWASRLDPDDPDDLAYIQEHPPKGMPKPGGHWVLKYRTNFPYTALWEDDAHQPVWSTPMNFTDLEATKDVAESHLKMVIAHRNLMAAWGRTLKD